MGVSTLKRLALGALALCVSVDALYVRDEAPASNNTAVNPESYDQTEMNTLCQQWGDNKILCVRSHTTSRYMPGVTNRSSSSSLMYLSSDAGPALPISSGLAPVSIVFRVHQDSIPTPRSEETRRPLASSCRTPQCLRLRHP